MKLRNKKTGELAENFVIYGSRDKNGKLKKYNSMREFVMEWEDYEPQEPLIKDEKLCEAIRAWAYLARVGKDKVLYHIVGGKKEFEHYGNCLRFGSFDTYIGNVEDKTYYTITELCGESEDA